jgi:hypothetical protein
MWSWYQKFFQNRKPPDEWVENNTQKCTSNRLSFTLEEVDSSQSCRDYCILNAPFKDVKSYRNNGEITSYIKLDVVLTEYYKNSRECRCIGPEKKTPEENVGIYCETRSDAPQNYINTTRTTIIPETPTIPSSCTSCYNGVDNNCHTCLDVISSYQKKGWRYDQQNFQQCNPYAQC